MIKRTGFFLFAAVAAGFLALQAADYKGTHAERDQKDVLQLESDWEKAIKSGDIEALERILAPEYVMVDAAGKTVSRAQEIDTYRSGAVRFDTFAASDHKVLIYIGGAVVSGKVTVKGKYKKDDISGDYRFVDVLEYRKSGWQAVFSQITKVEDDKSKKRPQPTSVPRPTPSK
jgi:ketosteroid isomerase-like protein